MTSGKVCIVGAGFISNFHAQVLKGLPGITLVGVCDANRKRAEALAAKWKIPQVFASTEELIASKACDTAHVAVPPDLHAKVAAPLLRAGIHVFLEKPMAVSSAECAELLKAAEQGHAQLGINQNFAFHADFLDAKKRLETEGFGPIRHLVCHWSMPLRQLAARQLYSWMFQRPGNIILEQAVHPLSQIQVLAGRVLEIEARASGAHVIGADGVFYDTWQISMQCERATAQLLFSVGQKFTSSGMHILCDDGELFLDTTHGRKVKQVKTKWPPFFDSFVNGRSLARETAAQSRRNALDFLLSTVKLKPPTDAFIVSLRNSIAAFHNGLKAGKIPVDGHFAAHLVDVCERIAAFAPAVKAAATASSTPAPTTASAPALAPTVAAATATNAVSAASGKVDALIIGGTGFIGKALVKQMVAAGKRVRVMARNTRTLPEIFHHPSVEIVSGDMADIGKMREGMQGAESIIHLAHGGGGETWEQIRYAMVDGAENVAKACLEAGNKRLVHVGSIAALYLGDGGETITGKTPCDPKCAERSLYSRGKAECEKMLARLRAEKNLDYCILRPGIVIGEDGDPFHSGLGIFNSDRYCIGWNLGTNPLPLVLVEDVASSIAFAAEAKTVAGKAYNIIGDIRLNGREYIAELGKAMGRDLVYLPQPVWKTQTIEIGKWLVKVGLQRRKAPFPSLRDLKSRGCVAKFDCADFKADTGWAPLADREEFLRKGIRIHG